ncbi:MAG: hypothetical protein A3A65_00530 [Candidatus Chisholmbacteria bacterium RIFCSPLOWO2_01_FULL_49_14]|uniref:Glycosyltransferase 2-like domain-containing protein n=1 Tax=Candidatus Chisholmbacteria bacterium RIFCSPLOWO2_01_FULL_49_14 TaxID=1797593 RepID=A0A1G1VZ32_9BACT|nr:MAG: hypothetical protein A3A65_00530 [Candidatus Chisholmbacteria bacterium RIFCSPLOWO2_01_FULL_49_14]
MNVSIILPTYMERENIRLLIRRLVNIFSNRFDSVEFIVVDDNSPDQTAADCRQTFRKDPRVRVFERTGPPSLASSVHEGIKKAKGEYVVVMDTDFNHDPRMVPVMLSKMRGHDLVVGSRFVPGGGMQSPWRYRASKIYNSVLQILFRTGYSDYLSGFYCIRKTCLTKMNTREIFVGYGEYFMRLLADSSRLKLRSLIVPVYYRNRRYGFSKSKFMNMFLVYSRTALSLWIKKTVRFSIKPE